MTPPDLEEWLCAYLREQTGIETSNKEPTALKMPLTAPIVVVRDDSGPMLSQVTFDRSVGVSVLAGSRQDDWEANRIAREVAGILFDDAIALAEGSPIAAVTRTGCNGPYAVTEPLNVSRRYLTAQYVVVGEW